MVDRARRHFMPHIDRKRWCLQGFLIPTGRAEPVGSGTGLPVRLVRKSVETGEIQISNQNLSSIGSDRIPVQLDREPVV
jgi:hypothetical protein